MMLEPTPVFDSFWRFAAERQAILARRVAGAPAPWTSDPVLARYRFTNAFRVADRVSQHLIHHVQYGAGRSQAPHDVFVRTVLFKIFNRIETYDAIETALGPVDAKTSLDEVAVVLDAARARGTPLYAAAYVVPPPGLGPPRKHRDHLLLLARLLDARVPDRLRQAPTLADSYATLKAFPGFGPFLAFQLAIDLNYSTLIDHDEASFVVAGPGARDGIAKCFRNWRDHAPEAIIAWTAARQDDEFARSGFPPARLQGRPLQLVDCQNLFCEISKYARVAHPEVVGSAGRVRIKQGFVARARPLEAPRLPPKWLAATSGRDM